MTTGTGPGSAGGEAFSGRVIVSFLTQVLAATRVDTAVLAFAVLCAASLIGCSPPLPTDHGSARPVAQALFGASTPSVATFPAPTPTPPASTSPTPTRTAQPTSVSLVTKPRSTATPRPARAPSPRPAPAPTLTVPSMPTQPPTRTPAPTAAPTAFSGTVTVSSIPALKTALADNTVDEIVVANGTYHVSPSNQVKSDSLWIGNSASGGMPFAERTRPVTVRAATIGGVTFDGGGGSAYGGLSFEAGAHDQTWDGFNFANMAAVSTGIVEFGSYTSRAAPYNITLRHITILSSCTGRATTASGNTLDHAFYMGQALSPGPHDLLFEDITVDGRGGLASAFHFFHSSAGAPNASNVTVRRLHVTGTHGRHHAVGFHPPRHHLRIGGYHGRPELRHPLRGGRLDRDDPLEHHVDGIRPRGLLQQRGPGPAGPHHIEQQPPLRTAGNTALPAVLARRPCGAMLAAFARRGPGWSGPAALATHRVTPCRSAEPCWRPLVDQPADRPSISVIVPAVNEAATIGRAISPLLADLLGARLEVIVAVGPSTDGTREVVAGMAERDPRIRLVDNPERITPEGLNAAIRASRGGIILRMDGHAEPDAGYVSACIEALEDERSLECRWAHPEGRPDGRRTGGGSGHVEPVRDRRRATLPPADGAPERGHPLAGLLAPLGFRAGGPVRPGDGPEPG